MTYYNTTKQKGNQLEMFKEKALNQDERLYEYFKPNKRLSASMIAKQFPKEPITSWRRSLNSLDNEGKIIKTGSQVVSPFGRPENIYKLV